MDFDFSEEQRMLRDSVRDLLHRESDARAVRKAFEDSGRSPERWHKLGQLGVLGLNLPEQYGGSAMDEVDMVLVMEEAGRALLPEPLLEGAVVAGPLLARAGTEAQKQAWLPRLASGEATLSFALKGQPYVNDADADLLILEQDGELHAVTQERLTLTPVKALDQTRRLFKVVAEVDGATLMGPVGDNADWAFNRAAAAASAQLVGIATAMLDMTVEYAKQREQFGKKIGAFQAIQHKLAECLLLTESARSAAYYAAYALSKNLPDSAIHVSVAKAYASDAERRMNYEALQIHGGIGFTWEHDLHLWLKRGRALEGAFGDADWHRKRISDWVYSQN
ncbi:MAG: acyl-CoA dehydrogenase family protein [Candidatus Dormibacteria bacterium]